MIKQRGGTEIAVALVIILVSLAVIGLLFFGLPLWNVWKEGLGGQAELNRAQQNRHIKVLEAQAKLEAAEFLNKAEVKRAEGLAAANKILADGLGGPQGYLRYLWIQALEHDKATVIYVPTEAGLPILEAGKRP